jgi:hypothetical protein
MFTLSSGSFLSEMIFPFMEEFCAKLTVEKNNIRAIKNFFISSHFFQVSNLKCKIPNYIGGCGGGLLKSTIIFTPGVICPPCIVKIFGLV